jgi:hypothetical protein
MFIILRKGGDLFTDCREQEKLFAILKETEVHLGWSFLRAQERLREIWGL